ncbi:P-loop containing nucleoside triphosphate hydrolase protein [Bombardia bombarda]|uniref:P-loop containing nucleoside triphosphate hydrolase protein n=1 Tax=Bombardia bombarda TaxID=252184 RepID=A0AA39XNA7_9PEZI|nr:P-loop containing nucleoside triphosphate hydrolase protein [Bombardia bombarda]
MATDKPGQSFDGLGNQVYLEKQDKLRDIGVDIHTSQIVVVGGQSSGKSSLLESLTGFSFPRGQGLCTRYATQITLRRNPVKSHIISITPRNNADAALQERLRAFHRELDDFEGKKLAKVIEEANTAMGIRSGPTKDDTTLPTFSDDILKIEISGPDKPHLTVIDVPGLFQVTDEGHTTDLDKTMIENMVRRYMENERTIVLAVMTCLADRATEGILQFAKAADPKGERTVGVLTKADLATEKAVLQTILELVQGKTLKLGYFVVRNRGADDDDLDISQCRQNEKELFARPQWDKVTKLGRTGIEALRSELQTLLMDLAKRELPKQRAEVTKRLTDCRKAFKDMGPSRVDPASQRELLTKLTLRFDRITRDALEGRYDGNPIFVEKPELKLITKILGLNGGFAELMWQKGHLRYFVGASSSADHGKTAKYMNAVSDIHDDAEDLPELQEIITEDRPEFHDPLGNSIMAHIEQCYVDSRGPELGTFGGVLLAMTFSEQTKKWRSIVYQHVSAIIAVVHFFIKDLLDTVFVDERMRDELWEAVLLGKLLDAYHRAQDQTDYFIATELNLRPSTYNHLFNETLQNARVQRFEAVQNPSACSDGTVQSSEVNGIAAKLKGLIIDKSNVDQVKEDVHDILQSYYGVSIKRFVDNICRHIVEHALLEGDDSPLKILSPELVQGMSESQLDRIAGEDSGARRERKRLELEIQGLEAAMNVLCS